jgi:hypothetical protein
MNRAEKIQTMIENYTRKRDQSGEIAIMEFHRNHLLLFMNRFRQLLARFATPSSSLLSHEIFLVVEAATVVAKADWETLGSGDAERDGSFSRYFDAFNDLTAGVGPLDQGAALCVEVLSRSNDI